MSADASSAAAAANLAKIVNLIGSNVREEEQPPQQQQQQQQQQPRQQSARSARSVRLASSGTPRRSTYSYVPKSPQLEDIVFAEPTCSERLARYFVIVVYLCGLCCLGFFLSIYHIFFWDSRMPPVFKGQKKSPAFG
ncbi:uncharacterized protein LOC132796191 [Drosophila nasuta]|uniref:uncharacterized protein LOC132796191 n=1 Tax=Drosophila nasuta TaxID=42062 RepID=UPI00295F482B|nr:uncharacterized protein LOC132796191 [Drosophila nasuta]XP_060663251.1 uncharacterized protein LOC132796191 [Drosophila nasuta]